MSRSRKYLKLGALAVASFGAAAAVAQAQSLVVGIQTEATAIDPHNYVGGGDNQVRMHLFDSLVLMTASQSIAPALAESWTLSEDGKTWTFKLREGVKFHDGSAFDANDFLYTICRIRNFKEASSSYSRYTGAIDTITAPDAGTVVITTKSPYPALLNELSALAVISADAAGVTDPVTYDAETCGLDKWPSVPSFNSGAMAIGTGPFKYVDFAPSTHLKLARNDDYWGTKPAWAEVTLRPIPNGAARLASLLAGDVQLIDSPPPQDIERLSKGDEVAITSGPAQTLIYLQYQHGDEPAVGISGTDGKNPFKDIRVRKAVSLAIDRQAIVNRILQGQAEVATNVMGADYVGHNHDIIAEAANLDAAKALMAEAGYPNGFKLVMGATNDRYNSDARIAQAVAQMLSRIGIEVEMEVSPYSVFIKKWQASEYPFYMAGLAVSSVDMAQTLRALVGTKGAGAGFGVSNYGKYSNAELDAVILSAVSETDTETRDTLLQQANKMAVEDYAIINLMHPKNVWAHSKAIKLEPRNDNATLAASASPAQ